MTLRRSVRPRGGHALPCGLFLLALAACAPAPPSPSPAPAVSAAARPVIPVNVGTGSVRLDHPEIRSRPVMAAVPGVPNPATSRPRPKVVAVAPSAAPAEATSTPTPYVFASSAAPPRIIAINLSTLELTSGEPVSGTIETTSNVASVEARISGWSMSVPRTRIGHFEAGGTLPDIPFFLKGNYTLQLIARNAAGASVERDIPIVVR